MAALRDNNYYASLAKRLIEGNITPAEEQELARYAEENPWLELFEHAFLTFDPGEGLSRDKADQLLAGIMYQARLLEQPKTIPLYRKPFWLVAAAVLILGVLTWLLLPTVIRKNDTTAPLAQQQDVSAPVTNRASITLGNGRRIYLDSSANGRLAMQGTVEIKKLNDGQITYSGADKDVSINTLFNPRGSKVIHVMLGDGTQVWLNAESSITYPTAFTGTERNVKVTGEAYFEVAHLVRGGEPKPGRPERSRRVPFIVDVDGKSRVEVLGTHFNINAYTDEESIKTTLLEGKVKVSAPGSRLPTPDFRLLSPGQQAIIDNKIIIKDYINTENVIAWKNGYFNFDEAPFEVFMRQLARWYDVQVIYKGAIPKKVLAGTLGRNLSLTQVLKILSYYKVSYTLQNKIIIIH